MLRIKRVYDPPAPDDGKRILVDRIWPRGLSKEEAKIDEWRNELAPSTELRKWYSHDPAKWDEFRHRYYAELERTGALAQLSEIAAQAEHENITLVFAASDEEHSNAAFLKELAATLR